MSDFTYIQFAVYSGFSLESTTNTGGTIVDQDNDNQFEIGDWNGFNGFNYKGAIEVGGIFMPAFENIFEGKTYYFNPGPSLITFPNAKPNQSSSTVYNFCFAKGTRILTPAGERKVETLATGDPVLTTGGRIEPVRWIGRQTLHPRFGPANRLCPVRIRAGALGDGLPNRDLVVTADHALFLDGVLCCASALINGVTITRVPKAELAQTLTVYHVETASHALIIANGVPAETFIDHSSRRAFDNYSEFLAHYGEEAGVPELDYPRAQTHRQLPVSVRKRLAVPAVA